MLSVTMTASFWRDKGPAIGSGKDHSNVLSESSWRSVEDKGG
jgi:hypothetical protein